MSTTTRTVHLVRHGATELSVRGAYSSLVDVPLTAQGEEQAAAAADALRSAGIDLVVASPLLRARTTAERIAAATAAPLEIDERLVEVGYGPLEGLNREEAEARFGERYVRWREQPFGGEMEGMERLEDGLLRATAAVREAAGRAERPAVVAHQGSLRLVLIGLGRATREEYFRIQIGTGTVTTLDAVAPLTPGG